MDAGKSSIIECRIIFGVISLFLLLFCELSIHSISWNCFRLHGFTVNNFVHLTGILLWFFSIKCQLAYYFRFRLIKNFPTSIDYYYYAFKMIIYYDAWHRKSGFTLIWTRLIVKCACLSHFFSFIHRRNQAVHEPSLQGTKTSVQTKIE